MKHEFLIKRPAAQLTDEISPLYPPDDSFFGGIDVELQSVAGMLSIYTGNRLALVS
jgi:hypothetical protein